MRTRPFPFINTAVSASTTAVRDDPANQRPVFNDGTATVRYVNENNNVLTPGPIGDAVDATDGDGDRPVYTLSGTDMTSFDLDPGSAQLMTKGPLDHEKKNRYTVVVTADDSTGEPNSTARITVTIRVVDLDEAPVISNREFPGSTHTISIDRAEDATGAVANFTARDPEGVTPIVWSLPEIDDVAGEQNIDGAEGDDIGDADIIDRGRFAISSAGVLTFRQGQSPSFEGMSLGDNDNSYQVVVQASDGGMADEQLSWFKVTVTITDIEEPGTVTWTVAPGGTPNDLLPQPLLQFRVGALLTASVSDGDTLVGDAEWKWYRSSNKRNWSLIIEDSPAVNTDAIYIASDKTENNDVNMYLRAEATYTDERGDGKKAEFVSPNRVQGPVKQQNTPPELISGEVATRKVNEQLAKANVGAPVASRDDDGDALTFAALDGDDATVNVNGEDTARFAINPATGQITTVAGLDHEDPMDQYANATLDPMVLEDDNTYGVTVTAYDSSGAPSNVITVVITVIEVNEKPTFTAGPQGMVEDHAEDNEVLTVGFHTGDAGAIIPVTSTFTATDPEGATVTLTLEGADKAKFEFVELDTALAYSKMVAFKAEARLREAG